MGQSEARYLQEKFKQSQSTSCRREGEQARTAGLSSAENPFLRSAAFPAASGQSEADWFYRCDAWWRGWDAEDSRLRSGAGSPPVTKRA